MAKESSSETLRHAREEAGYTQQDIADELGVTRQTYSSIEANPDKATVLQARTICRLLSRNYERIFFARNDS